MTVTGCSYGVHSLIGNDEGNMRFHICTECSAAYLCTCSGVCVFSEQAKTRDVRVPSPTKAFRIKEVGAESVYQCPLCDAWQVTIPAGMLTYDEKEEVLREHLTPCLNELVMSHG